MTRIMRANHNASLCGAYISQLTVNGMFGGTTQIDISLIPDTSEIADYFVRLMRGDTPAGNTLGMHLVENEFTCVWCNSPNPITNRHCSQCGGPRGFIVGRR